MTVVGPSPPGSPLPPAGAPPLAGPFEPDRRDWLRLLGGVAFAAGAVVLGIRKSGWSDWAVLVVLLLPCVLLYGLALAGRRRAPGLQGWQSAFYAFAVLLLPLVLVQFVSAVGGDTSSRLNVAWILGLSAAVAVVTALRARAWWQMLVGGVYALGAWLAFWAEVLDDPSADTFRWLLILFAALLLLAALAVGRRGRAGASDLVTAAGVAAVLAGAVSLAGLNPNTFTDVVTGDAVRPTQGWNIYLLLVSLALIAYGARSRTRGPSYVGAVGLALFIGLAGTDVVGRLKGETGDGVAGWPLILLLGGAALLALSFLAPPRRGAGFGTTEPPGAAASGAAGAPRAPASSPGAPAPSPPAPAPGPAPPGQPPPPAPPPPG
jgi:hypothetical protein